MMLYICRLGLDGMKVTVSSLSYIIILMKSCATRDNLQKPYLYKLKYAFFALVLNT